MSTEPDEQEKRRLAYAARLKAVATWKAFLEASPPNTPKSITGLARKKASGTNTWWVLPCPRLQLHCAGADDGIRGFDCSEETVGLGYQFLTYMCRDCGKQQKTFALLVVYKTEQGDEAVVEAMKLGEYPPFAAPISARIAKLLGDDDLELYRKGTRSEAQGLGIGAATYFRRIVDNQWQRLVTEIRAAAEQLGVKDLTIYDAALKERQFSTAVGMLRDAIPGKLLILGGENPLTLLYRPLSVQLHDLTDEQCMQQAADIRLVLTALLENIADVLKDQDELREAANRLKQVGS